MMKLSRKELTVIASVLVVLVISGGWKLYEVATLYKDMDSFMSDAGQYMAEAEDFWREYGSRPASFYHEFSQACDALLDAYAGYTDYPYYIPVENNPAIRTIMLSTNPYSIKVTSRNKISVILNQFRDVEDMGFNFTWIKEPFNRSGNLYLSASSVLDKPIYSR